MKPLRLLVWAAVLSIALPLMSCDTSRRILGGLTPGEGEALVFLYLSSPAESPPKIGFDVTAIGFQNNSGQWFETPVDVNIKSEEVARHQLKVHEAVIPAGSYVKIKWVLANPEMEVEGKVKPVKFAKDREEVVQKLEFEAGSHESKVLFAHWDILASIAGPDLFEPKLRFAVESAALGDTLVLVACTDSNSVFLLDRRSDTVVGAVEVGRGPRDVVVTPNRSRAYVANYNSNNFSVIDVKLGRIIKTIENLGYSPSNLDISADGRWVVATNPEVDRVTILDTSADRVVDTLTVGRRPNHVIADEAGSLFFVSNSDSNSISVVDAEMMRVVREIQVGIDPVGLALQDELLYVANKGSSNLSVIDARTFTIEKTIPVSMMPIWVQAGLFDRIYMTNQNNRKVSFVLPESEAIVDTVTAGQAPEQMDVDILRKKIYVSEPKNDRVYVIDVIKKSNVSVIQVGNNPGGIAVVQ